MIPDIPDTFEAQDRCARICQAPGTALNTTCDDSAYQNVMRSDKFGSAAQASSRMVWSDTLTIAATKEATPIKIAMQLRGGDLASRGALISRSLCSHHALSGEVCRRLTTAIREGAKASRAAHGEDSDVEVATANKSKLVLVTAASHVFFGALMNLVGSVHFWEGSKKLPILVYDLGLTVAERAEVRGWAGVSLRTFDFSAHPDHVRDLYNYAWKPIVIQDALSRCTSAILYQDAGQELRQPLHTFKQILSKQGYFFTAAGGIPATATTHPGMLRDLGVNASDLDSKNVLMALGGNLALKRSSPLISRVIEPTLRCALREECIAPPGATTLNHCFDQSALSIHLSNAGVMPNKEWRWHAHHETFYMEARPHRYPLANAPGSFKEVHPGEIMIYSRRNELPRPFLSAIRKKC